MRFIFIGVGTALMLVLSLTRKKQLCFTNLKAILFTICLTASGVLGAYFMYFIENGSFGGISFYGSVLLIPLLLFPLSFAFKVKYLKILDFSVPMICIMLVSMRVACLITGCCGGIVLFTTASGVEVRFPNQIMEMVVATAIMSVCLFFEKTRKFECNRYSLFFISYGVCRLILNFFREDLGAFFWFLPAGHFWSIISIIIGSIWFLTYWLKCDNKGSNVNEQ